METKKLEAFVAAWEFGSFTKAAEQLGYTQSGLTQMISGLERELGLKLLDRGHFGTTLTPEGEQLLPYINDLIGSGKRLTNEIERILTAKSDTVRIGAYSSITKYWLPSILQYYRKICPDVSLEIMDGGRKQLYQMILNSQLDLAFVSRTDESGVEWFPLGEDPLLAVLPPDSHLADGMDKFPLSLYQSRRFLMPSLGFDSDILAVLGPQSVEPDIRHTSVNDDAVISMVSHGLGISMLSELTTKGQHEPVIVLPLDPDSARHLGIITQRHRNLPPSIEALIDCARAIVPQL